MTEAATHDLAAPAPDDSGNRSPFPVMFRGPVDPILAQQTCRLEQDSLGPIEIFIVPIRPGAAGVEREERSSLRALCRPVRALSCSTRSDGRAALAAKVFRAHP